MTSIVFIGGSRRITRLDAPVKARLNRIIEKQLRVILGDASGVDKLVQEHLRDAGYPLVEVFCTGDECRHNVGGWPTRSIPVSKGSNRKDFSFYATKDRAMAEEATVGLMLWDSESVGTAMNVLRMVQREKSVVVYIAPQHEFVDVKSQADFDALLRRATAPLKARVNKEFTAEQASRPLSQPRLL